MNQKKSLKSLQNSFSHHPQQSYAPFGSLSLRSKKKKKESKNQVGPGAYDISLPIVKPIIQTFKKRNNNIIVKLAHIGTSSFQSEKDRFYNQNSAQKEYIEKVGPGKYSPEKSFAFLESSGIQKSAEIPQRKQAGIQLLKFIKNRQRKAATISEVKKIEIEDYVEMPSEELQQSSQKNLTKQKIERIKGAAWSMMKEERLRQIKEPFSNLGPGKYYVDDFLKKQSITKNKSISEHSAAFKSESVRSFFDLIKFETNKDIRALLRQASGYKSNSLGPGAYEILQKNSKDKLIKFQFFGSTVER